MNDVLGVIEKRIVTLEDILKPENIKSSLEHLLEKNNNGRGSDGIKVSEFQDYWQINATTILESIRENVYMPGIVLEQERVSASGKRRKVSMFTCTDRLILRAVAQILQPFCEKFFSDHSHAYRNDHGVGTAVEQATSYINAGYRWVAEIDIERFFDTIPIAELEKCLAKYFEFDEAVELLIGRYLHCRCESDGKIVNKQVGVVQGSPLSPILSNLYLHTLDMYMESRDYAFVRFADDINIYAKTDMEASEALENIIEKIHGLQLSINKDKSGVYEAKDRFYLGYRFQKQGKKYIATNKKLKENFYENWHQSAIQKVERNYHLVNNGILSKQDYTVLFENDNGKRYLPVETTDALNVYSDIIFTSNFFSFVAGHKLRVSVFDKYGNGVGTFTAKRHGYQGKTMLKQATVYLDEGKRLEAAKKIMMAAMHNIRSNVRYYYKQKKLPELEIAINNLSEVIAKMNEARTIGDLMLIEARGRQVYYNVYNYIICDEEFKFTQRTKRPPKDALNAMISFGNTYMYNRIATEIQKTSLDIRIGIVHATTNRDESLNLDIAELFKPLIVDRVIFTMINRKMIDAKRHFEEVNNGSIYLNKEGKSIFLGELERKIHSKVNIGERTISNHTLICDEISKIYRMVAYDEKYKPYKYSN